MNVNDVKGTKAVRKAGIGIGVSGDVRNESSVDADVIFVGNSYVGMWRWGLAVIGHRRHIKFNLYHRSWCTLVPLPYLKVLPSHCHAGLREMWRIIRKLKPGTFIGMSSTWFLFRDPKFHAAVGGIVKDLASELKALHLHPFYLSDTPGMAEGADRYFACSAFSWMPLNKVWYALSGLRPSKKGTEKRKRNWSDEWAYQCVPGLFDEGYAPLEGRVESHLKMKQLTAASNMTYVDLFEHMCGDIGDSRNVTCKMPGNQTYGYFDTGYARDRHHLSVFGSFSLASFMDDQLVKMGALSATS